MKDGKHPRSFSLTDGQIAEFDELAASIRQSRSQLLLALMEAMKSIPLALTIEGGMPVLRPKLLTQTQKAVEEIKRAVEEKSRKKNPPDPNK